MNAHVAVSVQAFRPPHLLLGIDVEPLQVRFGPLQVIGPMAVVLCPSGQVRLSVTVTAGLASGGGVDVGWALRVGVGATTVKVADALTWRSSDKAVTVLLPINA
jgi:hypothetical protein